MTENSPGGTVEDNQTFDADYVRSLRQEAGKYRQQARDLESKLSTYDSQIKATRVENELIRRGVQAAPEWVQMTDDQSPAEAVESFLEKYPHLAPQQIGEVETEEPKTPKKVPEAIPPSKNTSPGPQPSGHLRNRSLEEIEQDPKARANLRDLYRDLLRQSSHQGDD